MAGKKRGAIDQCTVHQVEVGEHLPQVREAPHVAQSDGVADARHEEVQFASPLATLGQLLARDQLHLGRHRRRAARAAAAASLTSSATIAEAVHFDFVGHRCSAVYDSGRVEWQVVDEEDSERVEGQVETKASELVKSGDRWLAASLRGRWTAVDREQMDRGVIAYSESTSGDR